MQMRSSAMDIVPGTTRGEVDPWRDSVTSSSGSYWPSNSSSQGSSTSSHDFFSRQPDPVFGLHGLPATLPSASPEVGSYLMGNAGADIYARNPFATARAVPSNYGARSRLIQEEQNIKPNFDPQDPPKRLHVSNIPFRWRENELARLFETYGEVMEREVIFNDRGSKGFGFVTMKRGSAADYARMELHHSVQEGRQIEVNMATPKPSPAAPHVMKILAETAARQLKRMALIDYESYGTANDSFSSDRSTPTSTPQPGPVADWRKYCTPPGRELEGSSTRSGTSGSRRGRATSESLGSELDVDVNEGPYPNPYADYALNKRRTRSVAAGAVVADDTSFSSAPVTGPGRESASMRNTVSVAPSSTAWSSASSSTLEAWPAMSTWQGVENELATTVVANRNGGNPFSSYYSEYGITQNSLGSSSVGWDAQTSGSSDTDAVQECGRFWNIGGSSGEKAFHWHGHFCCVKDSCAPRL